MTTTITEVLLVASHSTINGNDVVEAHVTVLNWTGILLTTTVARSKLEGRGFDLEGLCQSLSYSWE